MKTSFEGQKSKRESYLISVVVPAYNIESYMHRSLDSILAQTHSNLEVIVVNDGSTDKTGEVVDSYSETDPRIVVIHKENEGVSVARNVGIDRARGDYIGFVDGDDAIEADMYEFLLNNAIEHDADISHCGHTMVTDEGDVPHYGTGTAKRQDMVTGILDLLEGTLVDPGLYTKLYNRTLFNEISLVAGLRINEDLLINYYLFKQAGFSYFVDISKYNYIKRPGSATTSTLVAYKIVDQLRVAKEIMEDASGNEEFFERAEYRFLMALFNISRDLIMSKDREFSEVKPEVLADLKKFKERFSANGLMKLKYYFLVKLILNCPIGFRLIYNAYNTLLKCR